MFVRFLWITQRPIRGVVFWVAFGLFATPALGGVLRSLTLAEMVELSDDAIYGRVVERNVEPFYRADLGPCHRTTLTIRGRRLSDGRPATVRMAYLGGNLSAAEGTHVSTMPESHYVARGRSVVAFHASGPPEGIAPRELVSAYGGLYAVVSRPGRDVVLGRGNGFAIANNMTVVDLARRFSDLHSLSKAPGGNQ